MKGVLRPWEWCVLFVVVAAVIAYVLIVPFMTWPLVTGGGLLVVSTLLFGLALDMKTTRIRKGVLTIGLGVITVMIYNLAVKEPIKCALVMSYEPSTCVLDFSQTVNGFIAANTIDTMVLLISLACGGVGGSILAAHGDKTATDSQASSHSNASDVTPLIESIIQKLDRQNRKINMISVGAVLVLFVLVVRVFA